MGKRKSAVLVDSDDSRSSDSDSGSDTDLDKEMLSLSKKNKGGVKQPSSTTKPVKMEAFTSSSASSSGNSGSDSDTGSAKAKKGKRIANKAAKRARRSASGTTQSSDDVSGGASSSGDEDADADPSSSSVTSTFIAPPSRHIPHSNPSSHHRSSSSLVSSTSTIEPNGGNEGGGNSGSKNKTPSDLEEGEVSDDEDPGGISSEEEFNDGYDENLIGDPEDQARLSAMTEKDREQEIFKRIELRDSLRLRFELERKLRKKNKLEARRAKKGKVSFASSTSPGASHPQLNSSSEEPSSMSMSTEDFEKMDAKVRSQERKKTVEAKIDKKTQAMDALKASRDAKIQRAQEKEKMREEQEKRREARRNERERDRERGDRDEDDDMEGLRKDEDTSSSVGGNKNKNKKLRTDEVYSDDSGSSSSDDDTGSSNAVKKEKKRDTVSDSDSRSGSDSEQEQSRHKKLQYIDDVKDLNRIRLSRFKLERWLYLPFFAKIVKGCFVRIGMGVGPKNSYRVCEILDVKVGVLAYQFGAVKTNKMLTVAIGGTPENKKSFKFDFISNQSFTSDEFMIFKMNSELHHKVLPTLDEVAKKEKEIKEALEYQLQEEDVDAIIKEKAKFKNSPVNFAARKSMLMKEKEIAMVNGEDEKAALLTTEIHDLDERANELDKTRTSTISSISYINQRNRLKNVEEAEKAILEELKTSKGLKVEDPFTRRNTKPRIVSKPNAFLNGGVKLENGLQAVLNENSLTVDSIDGSNKDLKPDLEIDLQKLNEDADQLPSVCSDLFSAHDFDIKLDLDARLPPANLPILARPSITPIIETAPRRSLNLEEYKRKKGLI